MNKSLTPIVLFLLVCSLLMSSCTKEESTFSEYVPVIQTPAEFLASTNLPAILFSYNVLNTETNVLSSWLIDTDGNIRNVLSESNDVHETMILSDYYMDKKKEQSILTDSQVDLEELVDHFKNIRVSNNLEYDLTAEREEAQTLTSVYGYSYYIADHSNGSCNCGSGGSNSSSQLFQPVLLEQMVGSVVIQQNTNTLATLNWLKSIRTEAD